MGKLRAAISREQSVRLLGWGIRFFLAAALTAARLPSGAMPFALGFVAVAGSGAEGAAALLGTTLGLVLFSSFSAGLAHLAAGILIVTATTALHGLRIVRRPWFMPLCAAGLFFSVKLVYVLQALNPLAQLLPCLTATALTGLSARLYAPLLHPDHEELRPNALLALGLTLLCAVGDWEIAGASVGRAAMACLILIAAWQRGRTTGMTTGLGGGLLMDLFAGNASFLFTAAYGLAGLLAGMRTGRSRLSAGALFMGAEALLLLPATNALGGALLAESLTGALLFLLIPSRAFGGKRVRRTEEGEGAVAVEGLKERLGKAAAAFHDLYDSLGRAGAGDGDGENPAVIFDRAAERVCRNCSLCQLCWKREYVATFNALNDATPYLTERGRALSKDFPGYFADRCIHLSEFLAAVNAELSTFLLRREYRRELEETRKSARGQYAQLGELLSATAATLSETRAVSGGAAQPYRIGAALRPKAGESVCGDSVSSFETQEGLLCLLLSDGCGSGEAARRESALTNRLMRQFLEAGIQPEAALKTLNSALALRSAETGSFSTVDLLTLRLDNGEGALYKYGAAPSYLKKGGSVRRISGGALPVGLRDDPAPPDVTRVTLESGSFLVMISDGVADAGHDEWLQNLLAGWDGSDPQTLAGLVLQEAVGQNHLTDDCGIQVLYLAPGQKKRV